MEIGATSYVQPQGKEREIYELYKLKLGRKREHILSAGEGKNVNHKA